MVLTLRCEPRFASGRFNEIAKRPRLNGLPAYLVSTGPGTRLPSRCQLHEEPPHDMMKVGVGFSAIASSLDATREALAQALSRVDAPLDSLFLFSGPQHDPAVVIRETRARVGSDVTLFGGTSVGVITSDSLAYSGYEIGVAAIPKGSFKSNVISSGPITGQEFAAGASLGDQFLKQQAPTGQSNVVLLYDSIRETSRNGPPSLNLATPLLEGWKSVFLESGMPAYQPALAGMGLMADPMLANSCSHWTGSDITTQGALAYVIGGNIAMDTLTLHGCQPLGGYRTITRAEGNIIFEIDGLPAVDTIMMLLGEDSPYTVKDFPLFITLGVNRGQRFESFREENYANRLCFAVNEKSGALIMFEPDLKTGDNVQLMRRSIDLQYVKRNIDSYLAQSKNIPFFAFYIDCLGRAARFSGSELEDAAEVQTAMNDRGIPLLGVYSGVEIAKVGASVQALDWTGVLCLFSEIA